MKRTVEEIEIAINTLVENKKRCNRFSFFGEDNHEKIDLTIDVIKNNRNEDYIYSNFPSDDEDGNEDFIAHGLWQSAMSARSFLDGEMELGDLLYPENT